MEAFILISLICAGIGFAIGNSKDEAVRDWCSASCSGSSA
jgi:hypothetical protein